MSSPARSATRATVLIATLVATIAQAQPSIERSAVLDAMKRATRFMVETVSTEGGYVWAYLPDRSRRWGEMEARESMIWIQPPGTPTMGHLFLDAYHATRDEYYYSAAQKVAAALIKAQHPSGGWNYMADFAGERSLAEWYATIGRNGWRLEEFQHHWGNATFDDAGTAESAKFLLRLYLEKRSDQYKRPLDAAIRFVLDSQYPIGGWPQRFPRGSVLRDEGKTDYTAYLTFNDDVAAENIDFLVMCYQSLGDKRLLDPIRRGMDAFVKLQHPLPQAGWALQYTPDLLPAGARTYEPRALVTHTTAANVESLLRFHRLTGDATFLARIADALNWLDSVALTPEVAAIAGGGRTHPTFVELESNRPLYVHRTGSNVVNGRYFVDYDPKHTIGHYSAFRRIDTAGLRRRLDAARVMTPEAASKDSALLAAAGTVPFPRFFTVTPAAPSTSAADVIASLNAEGFWLAPLGYNTHRYKAPGAKTVPPGDFGQTHVGDEFDTSPFPDPGLKGISIEAYVRNMGVLIRQLSDARP